MTNLVTVLPNFDVKPYTHILPSLEKALISTADLLSLHAVDVAKRAQVPPGEVTKLSDALLQSLHSGVNGTISTPDRRNNAGSAADELEPGNAITKQRTSISTLDERLDFALGGGIRPGYLTEVVGESAAGKTQFLLTLLLSVQLSPPQGLGKSALYISTEAPLQTLRLAQILNTHPGLCTLSQQERPSLSRIQSTHIHDVEAQEHILRYQVPVALEKQNVGLLVIDSIAANYRAEFDRSKARKGAESFAKRSNQMVQLGALLRDIARTYGVAVVVANQVADRFTTIDPFSHAYRMSQSTQRSRPESPLQARSVRSEALSQNVPPDPPAHEQMLATDDPLALDHQQRFFTGWGDDPETVDFKTPSLGLTWTNQLATRIALLKEPIYEERAYQPGEDRSIAGWNRTAKIVFSAWCAERKIRFEIWEGGIRNHGEPDESGGGTT
ncbi:DNA repair protein rhp57 [Vermiconidia calcicola]|uniref:DNA repair protein rhp57 n=1 Tax=Vermiconidia calcicola TaxID=1690605 RepID=A0ACC3MUS3_9PEZI|nr:DNA repair protein rhp57 [Vermiconidia calcicola]